MNSYCPDLVATFWLLRQAAKQSRIPVVVESQNGGASRAWGHLHGVLEHLVGLEPSSIGYSDQTHHSYPR